MGVEFEGGFRIQCNSDTEGGDYYAATIGQQCSYYLGSFE